MLASLPRPRPVNRQSQCVASTVGMDPPGPRPHKEKHGSPVPSCKICVEHNVTWTAVLVTGRGQHRHTRAGASAEHGWTHLSTWVFLHLRSRPALPSHVAPYGTFQGHGVEWDWRPRLCAGHQLCSSAMVVTLTWHLKEGRSWCCRGLCHRDEDRTGLCAHVHPAGQQPPPGLLPCPTHS